MGARRILVILLLALGLGAFERALAQPDLARMATTLPTPPTPSVWTNDFEIYSESNYLPTYGLLTESRIRDYFLRWKFAQVYGGATIQHQDLSASKPAIYLPSVSPLAGIKATFWHQLTLFAEYRQWIAKEPTGRTTSLPDPRFGIADGDLIPLGSTPLFVEYYGEIVAVPRVSSTLVTTAWARFGVREKILSHVFLDPNVDFFVRHTPDPNLGVETSEPRAGVRLSYVDGLWSTSLLTYEAFREHQVQGLLVIGGQF